MKIFIWALYLPDYPNLEIEVRIGDRYKPDVVELDPTQTVRDANGAVRFWGESGRVGEEKIHSLARRYPDAHLVIAKWEKNLKPLEKMVRDAVDGRARTAPFDLLRFGEGDAERFISEDGVVSLTHDDIDWIRIEGTKNRD
ncbi:MAG: hypothetical protein AAF125_25605 [Chloroflexota bacterium]